MDNLLPHSGEVFYIPDFLSGSEADLYYKLLIDNIDWQQYTIKIFGKEVLQPRLSAWYGDRDYKYSGKSLQAAGWTKELSELKEKAEKVSGELFNSVLLNFYRDGKDSMGWHRDNERALGEHPVIASVSLGAERVFLLRHYSDKNEKIAVTLEHGSLLIMKGESQRQWEHALPKRAGVNSPRINLTFRNIEGT